MKKEFTMIVLLLVVAIIGILSIMVLVFLGESRRRASNTNVKAQIAQGNAAAEIYFGTNQFYGPPNISQASGGTSCTGSMFTDQSSGMLYHANSSAYPGGTNLICVQNVQDFAFAGSLFTPG